MTVDPQPHSNFFFNPPSYAYIVVVICMTNLQRRILLPQMKTYIPFAQHFRLPRFMHQRKNHNHAQIFMKNVMGVTSVIISPWVSSIKDTYHYRTPFVILLHLF